MVSQEFIKRTLISRVGGSDANRQYVEAISKYLIELQESIGSKITFINHINKNVIPFGFENGETYELYDWIDPYKDEKKKPQNYKPPVIKHRPAEAVIKESGWSLPSFNLNFDIVWFCIVAIFAGISAFGFIAWWCIIRDFS
ncbi:MAG: hypothetical protein LBC85_04830 [Fibromonadaceae bacterium]|jgi:hypothetical protein|nr:hypothetical protein [Fibromonadaceae bacterium]